MTSPAICVHRAGWGEPFSFSNCRFYFVTDRKRCLVSDKFFFGFSHEEYLCQEQRFDNLAAWAVNKIDPEAEIYLEGYAFGAKGQVFNIGENTGVLKQKIWQLKGYSPKAFTTFTPGTIKKFATGKGNADKVKMHEAFVAETSIKLDLHFGVNPGDSPISDIIDAYYISKLGYTEYYKQHQADIKKASKVRSKVRK